MNAIRTCVPLALAAALAACGGGSDNPAVAACTGAITERLSDKTFELDASDMAAKLKQLDSNVVEISSTVVFDRGLPSENRQTFTCRVKLDPGTEPAVIGLQFVW